MYNNKIIKTEPNIEEKYLIQIENMYGFKFPESFRKHYLIYNGGRTERDRFVIQGGEKRRFSYFYSIKNEEDNDLDLINMLRVNFDEESFFPKWLVRFADDVCGEELCWSRRVNEYGAIYIWDCDMNLGDDPNIADDYAVKLADSLEEFINNMVEDDNEMEN